MEPRKKEETYSKLLSVLKTLLTKQYNTIELQMVLDEENTTFLVYYRKSCQKISNIITGENKNFTQWSRMGETTILTKNRVTRKSVIKKTTL